MKLLDRFKAETPKLWKQVITICHTINATCGGVMIGEYAGVLPSQLTQYLAWIVGITSIIYGFAKVQVKPEDKC